jgi:pyrroloquinoline quinone (PQQ) biosynthesis protein C
MSLSLRQDASPRELTRYPLPGLCIALGLSGHAPRAEEFAKALAADRSASVESMSMSLWPRPSLSVLVQLQGSEPQSTRATIARVLASVVAAEELAALDRASELLAGLGAAGGASLIRVTFSDESGAPRLEWGESLRGKGAVAATAQAEEALCRLGFGAAWPEVARSLVGLDLQAPSSLLLSLDAEACSRVAIRIPSPLDAKAAREGNIRYWEPLAGELLARMQSDIEPGTGATVVQLARSSGGFSAFRALSFPIAASKLPGVLGRCLPDASQIRGQWQRCEKALEADGGLPERFELELRQGAQGVDAVTVSVPSRLPASVPPISGVRPLSPNDVMHRFEEADRIIDHPFMRRLRREPVNLNNLWILLANFQISISKNFARRLAYIASRVDDEHIRCILAEQLNDEMGRGDPQRAHIRLFSLMMQQLDAWKSEASRDRILIPGRRLEALLGGIYEAADINESIGALMVGEVFGEQMDGFLADEFRRQHAIEPSSLEWLMLHEQLEIEHADSSDVLASLIPVEAHDAAWRGARALFMAAWCFLDDVYSACFADGSNLA